MFSDTASSGKGWMLCPRNCCTDSRAAGSANLEEEEGLALAFGLSCGSSRTPSESGRDTGEAGGCGGNAGGGRGGGDTGGGDTGGGGGGGGAAGFALVVAPTMTS